MGKSVTLKDDTVINSEVLAKLYTKKLSIHTKSVKISIPQAIDIAVSEAIEREKNAND